jgi:hypothetical protein
MIEPVLFSIVTKPASASADTFAPYFVNTVELARALVPQSQALQAAFSKVARALLGFRYRPTPPPTTQIP